MSKRVRIKLNRAAVRALMKSPEMREILAEQAQAIAGRCGDGYAARRDNHKNNTLERALR